MALPLMEVIEKWTDSAGSSSISAPIKGILWTFVGANILFLIISPQQTFANYSFLFFFSPLWMPIILVKAAVFRFVQEKRRVFHAGVKHVLLELRIPRESLKSPAAMESVFSAIHVGPGEGTWYRKYIQGGTRPWYSFELVSLGGQIHFYIWTREGFRRLIETHLYAQYPGIEIIEAEDYSLLTDPSQAPYQMYGSDFVSAKPDPYPIKTYIDFGLDKMDLKPEYQVDPMAHILELLGALRPGEQIWLQFVIRVSKGEKYKGKKTSAGKPYTWKDEAKELIEGIRKAATSKTEFVDKNGDKKISQGFPNPTKGESETMAAIERNVGKLAFDVGIRGAYMGAGDAYQSSTGGFLGNVFKPFNAENYNALKTSGWSDNFKGFPWEDRSGKMKAMTMHHFVDIYRRRCFFHDPYIGEWNTMSTEELATLYHIPSSTVSTPSLLRIQSATSEAPGNLPV